MISITDQLTNN